MSHVRRNRERLPTVRFDVSPSSFQAILPPCEKSNARASARESASRGAANSRRRAGYYYNFRMAAIS
jgi:hypothetical protein